MSDHDEPPVSQKARNLPRSFEKEGDGKPCFSDAELACRLAFQGRRQLLLGSNAAVTRCLRLVFLRSSSIKLASNDVSDSISLSQAVVSSESFLSHRKLPIQAVTGYTVRVSAHVDVAWSFKGFYWPKSETKTMYKKSESDNSVCYTINRADMKGEVVVGTLYKPKADRCSRVTSSETPILRLTRYYAWPHSCWVATTKGTQIHPKRQIRSRYVRFARPEPWSPGSDDSPSLLTWSNVKVMVRSKSSTGKLQLKDDRSLNLHLNSAWLFSAPCFLSSHVKKPQARACNCWRVRGQTRPGTILVAIESRSGATRCTFFFFFFFFSSPIRQEITAKRNE